MANKNAKASNMVTDLNIDTEYDEVYIQIRARDLVDLYTNMSNGTDNPEDIPIESVDVGGLSDEGSDTFWLLSYYEAHKLLGLEPTGSSLDADWNTESAKDYYWIRSPYSLHSNINYFVYGNGAYGTGLVYGSINFAARAAFQI